jgi:effector-binding domain-containing protein
MRKKMVWIVIPAIVILGAVMWGPVVSNVEEPKYSVIESHDPIEIRDYAPKIIAQTDVTGERNEAISQGFRVIADYIFGNNISAQKVSQKIEMTAPVLQQQSETIAMTAPVLQEGTGNSWSVAFVMPDAYTMETLPKPNNDLVKIINVPEKRFAVIRFTGLASDTSLQNQTEKLKSFIKAHDLKAVSGPAYAFYNPPWTLPFMRRNEVMIEISK